MRKISRIALIVLLAVILGVLAWAVLQRPEPEPVYHGKPLSYWLAGLPGASPNPNSGATRTPTHYEAHEAMRAIGTNAIPFLLRQLRQRNSVLKEKCFFLLQKQHFIKNPLTPPWTHSMQALTGLTELQDQARSAVPQMIQIYDRHADPIQRQIITSILANLGSAAREAVPLLIRGLTDSDELVRNNSAYALGRIHEEPQLVVPALIKCLHDPSSHVRSRAVNSLGSFGAKAQSALPALRELLSREQATPPGTSSAIAGDFGTMVNYMSASRPKGASILPFDSDVIGSTDKALKAIAAAVKALTEKDIWQTPPLLPAR